VAAFSYGPRACDVHWCSTAVATRLAISAAVAGGSPSAAAGTDDDGGERSTGGGAVVPATGGAGRREPADEDGGGEAGRAANHVLFRVQRLVAGGRRHGHAHCEPLL